MNDTGSSVDKIYREMLMKLPNEKIRQDAKDLAEKRGFSFIYTLNEREIR